MILSTLAGLGIDFVVDLMKDKGQDLAIEGIKKVTGIDLSKEEKLTPEQIEKIKAHEVQIKTLDFKELELQQKNTDSARAMNSNIQDSANASPLAKVAAYYIDFAIIGATIAVGMSLFFFDIPNANKELAYMMFGSLMTLSGTIINFHRGSTQGSKDKTHALHSMMKAK